jgi:ABC-type lipoprotein export system ATPase subunit/bifunctional DNA-binding transcriptional regulator/antitoxin component of YhaV-PrlF toxin-antitoxin module
MEEPFIACDNLVKIYKIANLETVALQGLDLVVAPGELMGIIGPSGSGKSTLMNILGGLDRPSAGRVWVGGQDLLKMSNADLNRYRRAQVGFIWQQVSRNLVPYLTAQENVELPMTLAGSSAQKRRRADELLAAVGLAERRHHRLAQMSGGEQQRVAIAVALANNPRLLLADEPTGEVDSATALTIYDTFKRLNREYGLTTLIVSHDPGIARHVNRVVAIQDGKMATETVRRARLEDAAEGEAGEEEDDFHELVVLDSAGRLRVPKEYLEQFDIKGRVMLDVVDDGILIQPVPESMQSQAAEQYVGEMVTEAESRSSKAYALLRQVGQRALGFASRLRRRKEQHDG